jgi:hypothetical protein
MADSTISTRISLEGAEDIQKQLADLGTAGETAFKQIADATNATGGSAALSGLSNIAATLRNAFGSASEALAPLRTAFGELGEAILGVGEHLKSVAEVFGIGLVAGLAGGVAGIFELIKAAAESSHQLEIQAGALGLSVEQLQVYRAAAAAVGVDADKLFTSLARLAQNVGKEHENLNQSALKVLESLPAAATSTGVAVVQGIKPAGDAIKSNIIDNIQQTAPQVQQTLDVLTRSASDLGAKLPASAVEAFRKNIQDLAVANTDAGAKFREAVAALGIMFPPLTFGEQFKDAAEKAKSPLLALGVTLKDLQDADGNLDPVIRKLITGFGNITDPADKAQLGLAVLGRGWKDLIKLFDGGVGSIDAVKKALEEQGLVLNDADVKTGAEAAVALTKLEGAAKKLRDQLGVIFAPASTEAASAFKDLITQNADALKDLAKAIATEVLPGIGNLIKQFGLAGDAAKKEKPPELPIVAQGRAPTVGAGGKFHGGELVTAPAPHAAPETPAPVSQAPEDLGLPPIDTSRIQDAQLKLDGFKTTLTAIKDDIVIAFTVIKTVLDGIASATNSLFGTMITGAALAIGLAIGRLSGVFGLLLPLLRAVAVSIAFLATPLGLGVAFFVLLAATIVQFWPQISGAAKVAFDYIKSAAAIVAAALSTAFRASIAFVVNLWNGLFEKATQIFGAISGAIQQAGAGIAQFIAPAVMVFSAIQKGVAGIAQFIAPAVMVFSDLVNAIGFVEQAFNGLVDWVKGSALAILGFLQPVIDFVTQLANKIAGLFSSAASAGSAGGGDGGGAPSDGSGLGLGSGDFNSGAGQFASGGPVSGPSGTDTVPAWLTAGEFVIRAGAVQHYGGALFAALNGMRMPFDTLRHFSMGGFVQALGAVRPPPLRFADGGMVPALAGGGSSGPMQHLTLNLNGHSFGLSVSPGEVFDKLSRHARASSIRSAGRKPGWFGG